MFTKNDMILVIAKTIIYVVLGILAVGALVGGIWLAIEYDWVYITIIFGGWILCAILWVFAALFFSFFTDVKLIRNKLYGENSEFLGFDSNRHDTIQQDNKDLRHVNEDWYSKQ